MSLSLSIQKLSTLMYEIPTFPQDSIVTAPPLKPSKYDFDPLYHKAENFRTNQKHIAITPPSFMKFCPVVPEICRGQVHGPQKERRRKRRIIIIKIKIIIIIRNGAKTISLPTLFGRLNNNNNNNDIRSRFPWQRRRF